MDLIIWRDSFNVGFNMIDHQHQNLVRLINDLFNSMAAKDKEVRMRKIFDELFEYTVSHFSLEESFMNEFNYKGYLAHKDEHSQFIIKVRSLKEKFLTGDSKVHLETLNFLKDWLLNHIIKTDKVTFSVIKPA